MSQARNLTKKSAADRNCFMAVSGRVEKVIRRTTDRGNLMLLVDVLTDDNDYRTRLRYINVRQPIPAKGQHVTITGVPLELKGRFPTNIGAVKVDIG